MPRKKHELKPFKSPLTSHSNQHDTLESKFRIQSQQELLQETQHFTPIQCVNAKTTLFYQQQAQALHGQVGRGCFIISIDVPLMMLKQDFQDWVLYDDKTSSICIAWLPVDSVKLLILQTFEFAFADA
eukprot:341874_1